MSTRLQCASRVGLLIVAVGCLGLAAATAEAKARPRVRFAFVAPAIEAGQPIGITYHISHRPAGSRLELQRAVGTASVWRRVISVKPSQTAALAPTAAQGIRPYRLALLGKHRRLLAHVTHSLRVYGPSSLATVLSSPTDTVQIGGGLFRYLTNATVLFDGGDYCLIDAQCSAGTPLTAFKITGSSCRSVSLQLGDVVTDSAAAPPVVTIVSEAADPTSVRVPLNSTTSLTGLVVGDVEVDLADQPHVNFEDRLYLNGTADCYTATGSTNKSASP